MAARKVVAPTKPEIVRVQFDPDFADKALVFLLAWQKLGNMHEESRTMIGLIADAVAAGIENK